MPLSHGNDRRPTVPTRTGQRHGIVVVSGPGSPGTWSDRDCERWTAFDRRSVPAHPAGVLPEVMELTGEIKVSDRESRKTGDLVQEVGSGHNANPVGNERHGSYRPVRRHVQDWHCSCLSFAFTDLSTGASPRRIPVAS